MSRSAPYHHGDLRNALINAAAAELEQQGLANLSLRAVAARAGVSHAAPAHHFGNLKGLLTALATIGFTRFHDCMHHACQAAAADPVAQVRAAYAGYVAFATSAPQMFQLIFSGPMLDWREAALAVAAGHARALLAAIVAPFTAQRGGAADEQRRLELLVWSTVHGYCHLLNAGQLQGGPAMNEPVPEPPDIAGLLLAAMPRP